MPACQPWSTDADGLLLTSRVSTFSACSRNRSVCTVARRPNGGSERAEALPSTHWHCIWPFPQASIESYYALRSQTVGSRSGAPSRFNLSDSTVIEPIPNDSDWIALRSLEESEAASGPAFTKPLRGRARAGENRFAVGEALRSRGTAPTPQQLGQNFKELFLQGIFRGLCDPQGSLALVRCERRVQMDVCECCAGPCAAYLFRLAGNPYRNVCVRALSPAPFLIPPSSRNPDRDDASNVRRLDLVGRRVEGGFG